ncbi:MBL fold metallo-hydrolase, partial [Helicobacter sp. T3_23-1059]
MKELASTKSRIKSSPNFIKGRAQNREKTALHPQNELQEAIRQAYNQARLQAQSTQDNLKSSPKPHPQEVANEPPMSKFRVIVSLLNPTNVVIPSIKSDLSELSKSDSFVWFGHSSYMLNLGGQRLLIDPILNDNAAPVPFVIRPFHGADIYAPSDISSVDFLIITHNHYDHLSKSTIRAIASKVKKAIVPLGVGKYLKAWGISEDKITELDWNEKVDFSVDFGALRFHCLTARHYSSRGLLDRDKTLWASFLVEYGADSHKSQSKKIFIGGDSGYGAHFAEFG